MNTYLIIEHYKEGKAKAIYDRFLEKGRMLPGGVEYVNSWVEENLTTCYQIMRSENIELLNVWIHQWNDLVDFEVIKVISSAEVTAQLRL